MASDIKQALENFLTNDEDFADAVVKSTIAAFSGSSFGIEFFGDGTYRVPRSQIGNCYESTGRILSVIGLHDEDYRDLCEVAGSSDPDELAKELAGSGQALEMAQDMRDGFEDGEKMREEWAQEYESLAPEYKHEGR